jgi:hypothetical protein
VKESFTPFTDVIATDISWMRRKLNILKRVAGGCGKHNVQECQWLISQLALRRLNFETNIQDMHSVNMVSLKTVILCVFFTCEISSWVGDCFVGCVCGNASLPVK